jgi:hypothetical protein
MSKITKYLTAAGVAVIGIVATFAANAQAVPVSFPTSTANTLLAFVGGQVADPGLLLVVVIAAAVPLTFYVIHQLIGLIPKSRGSRRS